MADGYEPTSAVTQQGAALSAQYGNPNGQGINWAQMQQQGELARRGQQIDREHMQQQANQFQQGTQLQREGIQFEREKLAKLTKAQADAQEHDIRLEDVKQQHQMENTNRRLQIETELQAAELEMAKAHGADREAKAARVASLREQRNDITGKAAVYDAYSRLGREGLLEASKRVKDTHNALKEQKKASAELGKSAAGIASRGIHEDMYAANTSERDTLKNILGRNGYDVARFEGDFGYNFVSPTDLGLNGINAQGGTDELDDILGSAQLLARHAGSLVGFGDVGADRLIKIDDAKINQFASSVLSKRVADGIAQATGGKIAVDDLRQAIEGFVKTPGSTDPNKDLVGPQGPNDPMDAMQKLTSLGVPPDVAKSALMEVANNLSGANSEFAFHKQSLLKSLEGVPMDSPRVVATQAAIKALERVQEEARTLGTHIQGLDVDGLQSTLSYLDRVSSGIEGYDPNVIAGTIPDVPGSELDDQLRSLVRDRRLTDLSQFGPDAFRKLDDLLVPLKRRGLDLDNQLQREAALAEQPAQGTYDDLLRILNKSYQKIRQ